MARLHFQGMPGNTRKCQGMPGNSKECQGIPRNAKECQEIFGDAREYQAMPPMAGAAPLALEESPAHQQEHDWKVAGTARTRTHSISCHTTQGWAENGAVPGADTGQGTKQPLDTTTDFS